MNKKGQNSTQSLPMNISSMAFLTVCAIFSLRNLSNMAEYGWSVIIVLFASCVLFFIPSALVSAELASNYPKNGGVFVWVQEAFGSRWGFVAIFMEWVQNLPWYPACLTFVSTALAYAINPSLAENKWFIFFSIQIGMWGATWLNCRGIAFSVWLSNIGLFAGTLLPGVLIMVISAIYLLNGNAPVISFEQGKALIPDLRNSMDWMLLTGMIVSLAGMEMSAVYVKKMNNPSKSFPKALLVATIIVILLSTLGALAIAFVVPKEQLSLSAGICQAFEEMLKSVGAVWLAPILALLLAVGSFSMVITWINGPSTGLLEVAQEGYIPQFWRERNKNGTPIAILVTQAIFASLLSINILITPTISNAFWILSALCSQLYMIMYFLMFAASIRLRYKISPPKQTFKIPGGKPGIWLVSGAAFLTSLIAFLCGFIPPAEIQNSGMFAVIGYETFLVAGILLFLSTPILFFHFSQKKPKPQ